MADYSIDVAINADDNASPVMEKVADSAKTMGDAIKDVGKDGGTELKSFAQNIQDLDKELTTVGRTMTAFGAGITTAFTAPIALGTKAAWDQVDAVQQATVALRAYESDASAVNRVLSELVAYARSDMGVLFQREDLFAAAQGLRVMGAETQNLVEYVEIMSRSVGVGAGNWDELTRVIGRVGSTARLTGVDFDMLTKMGFQLDESARNSTVTWEELFSILDRGIPADALAGQADTIMGSFIRLQSAIRDLGADFLNIDRETSQFISGGLGDQLVSSISNATGAMSFFSGAATIFGNNLALMMEAANMAAFAIRILPPELQTLASVLGTATGLTLTFGGALLVLAPRIVAIGNALRALAGAGGVALLATRFTLVGAAIAGLLTVGGYLVNDWMEQRQAAAEYEQTLGDLGTTLETLRRQGELDLARQGFGLQEMILEVEQLSDALNTVEEYVAFLGEPLPHPQAPEFGEFVRQWEEASAAAGEFRIDTELTTAALDAIDAALRDVNVNGHEFLMWATNLMRDASLTEGLEDDIEALETIAATMDEMPEEFIINIDTNADEAAASMDALYESVTLGNEAFDSLHAEEIADGIAQIAEEAEAAAQELLELQHAWLENTAALGGWGDALSLINLSSMGSDMSQFAVDARTAGEALENTFRIIVGNTDAIISQAQGIQTWADELINVRGELGLIDDLLAGGFIDETQYHAAQVAYDGISESVLAIGNNLQAVQAIQAPFIASAIEGTAAWTAELLAMDEAQQRTALAFMDMDTVVQAHEIVLHGATIAATRFGEQGQAAFEAMVQGALAANPLLFEVLETMGILEGTSIDFDINWDALREGASDMDRLVTSIEQLVSVLAEIYDIDISLDVEDNATPVISDVMETINEWGGIDTEANISANDEATPVVSDVMALINEWGGIDEQANISANDEATPVVSDVMALINEWGGIDEQANISANDEATPIVDDVMGKVNEWGGLSADADIGANDTATPVVDDLAGKIEEVDGTSAEAIVTATIVNAEAIGEVFEMIRNINEAGAADINVTFNADTSEIDSALAGISAEPIEVLFQPNTSQIDSLDFMALDFTVEVLFQPNTSQIESLDFSALDTEVEVVFTVDRSALDLEIANLSGAIGGGSDPNAFSPTVTVIFEADTSAIQLENLGLPDDIQIEVAITANMGGPDGLLTAVDNALIEIAGKSAEVAITLAADDAISRLDEIVRVVNDLQAAYIQIDIGLAADGAINTLNEIVRVVNDLQASSTTISITTNAEEALASISTVGVAVAILDMAQATVTIGETGSGETIGAITNVGSELAGLNGNEAIVTMQALGEAEALSAIHSVRDELAALHGNEAVVTIEAINNASSVIESVSGQLSALDGRRATSYVDTVNRTFNQTFGVGGGGFHQRMGGVIGYAMGGIVAELAEAGGEMLHLANGGQVPVYDRGYYEVDRGAYVSPHSNNESMGDGLTINLNVAGSITTEERLIERAADRIARTLAKSTRRRMMGSGNR